MECPMPWDWLWYTCVARKLRFGEVTKDCMAAVNLVWHFWLEVWRLNQVWGTSMSETVARWKRIAMSMNGIRYVYGSNCDDATGPDDIHSHVRRFVEATISWFLPLCTGEELSVCDGTSYRISPMTAYSYTRLSPVRVQFPGLGVEVMHLLASTTSIKISLLRWVPSIAQIHAVLPNFRSHPA